LSKKTPSTLKPNPPNHNIMTSLEDAFNAPISTDEAASMLRRQVPRNERPDTAAVIKANNARVADWKKRVLDKMAGVKGSVPASRVWESWLLYKEGLETGHIVKLRALGMVPEPNMEAVMFWKDLFEKLSIEDLHVYGSGPIAIGWGIVQNYIHLWLVQQKQETLFGVDEDPLYWEKNYHKCSSLLRGELFPFWDKETYADVRSKVSTILNIQVNPDGGFKM